MGGSDRGTRGGAPHQVADNEKHIDAQEEDAPSDEYRSQRGTPGMTENGRRGGNENSDEMQPITNRLETRR